MFDLYTMVIPGFLWTLHFTPDTYKLAEKLLSLAQNTDSLNLLTLYTPPMAPLTNTKINQMKHLSDYQCMFVNTDFNSVSNRIHSYTDTVHNAWKKLDRDIYQTFYWTNCKVCSNFIYIHS